MKSIKIVNIARGGATSLNSKQKVTIYFCSLSGQGAK